MKNISQDNISIFSDQPNNQAYHQANNFNLIKQEQKNQKQKPYQQKSYNQYLQNKNIPSFQNNNSRGSQKQSRHLPSTIHQKKGLISRQPPVHKLKQQNVGLNVQKIDHNNDNMQEDPQMMQIPYQQFKKMRAQLQRKNAQISGLKFELQKERKTLANTRVDLSIAKQKLKKQQNNRQGPRAIVADKQRDNHNNNNQNNNNNNIKRKQNENPGQRFFQNYSNQKNNNDQFDEEDELVMAQIAALERGENPDQFLAKNIYHKDMKKMQKKMDRFQIEFAERQQLKQIMEESKKEAMNNAGIVNDQMTYEELLELTEKAGKVSRGLSTQEIEKTLGHYLNDGREDFPNCTICMSELKKGQQYRMLPCAHCYHIMCIDEWLQLEKNCPTCKEQIVPIVAK